MLPTKIGTVNDIIILLFLAAGPDPVYELLRCAAAIRKNSSMDEASAGNRVRSRQNTTSLDRSNSSRSSSPNQG